MMNKVSVLVCSLFCLIVSSQVDVRASVVIDDSDALHGVHTTKGLFDINVSDAQKLELYLNVIKKTHDDLVAQGQRPDFVIAFRGASVRFISSELWSFSVEDQQSLQRSAAMLRELKALGVKLEACSIATDLFKIDNSTILPEIKVVGNTFVSLIGYQAQGYGLVPIQ
jgi:intracellular sulfur oxidation DsrE/DsrF family protein